MKAVRNMIMFLWNSKIQGCFKNVFKTPGYNDLSKNNQILGFFAKFTNSKISGH